MKDTTAARKYARALFAESSAKNEILACQKGLEEFARVSRLRASLMEIFGQPFIAAEEKQKLIHSVLGEVAKPLLERFLYLLVEKKRVELLPRIVQEFQEEVDRHQNVQSLRIRTAYALSEAQQKKLQSRMESSLGSKVRMEIQVDPRLIGGLLIQTQDAELDQSLRGKLRQMRQQLTAI